MRRLVTGLLIFSVATGGVLDIVRINNNCTDGILKDCLVQMLTRSLELPSHDVKVKCKQTQSSSSKKKASSHWKACTSDYPFIVPSNLLTLSPSHFSDNNSILAFYWRPQTGSARLLFTSTNPWGQELHYCNPLTRLRAFRDGSILKLCMASSSDDHLFWTWAELKFIYHERMVLFYSTFVALKRQDSSAAGSLPTALIEDPRDMEEELLFSGVMRDRDMFHVLRLLQDFGSGVLRLEARSYRGDRDEVPIWTAFLTNYKDNRDRDIFNLEGRGVVSMICPKPKPYIFVPEYGLPLMSDGNFALQFVSRNGEFLDLLPWNVMLTFWKQMLRI
jgi:hypothetical protein